MNARHAFDLPHSPVPRPRRRASRPASARSARTRSPAQPAALARLRASIARDLHDDIGSGLGSIAVLADLLAEGGVGGGDARDLAARIARTATELSESLGAIVWSLRGSEARLGQIAVELGTLAADLCPDADIDLRVAPGSDRRAVAPVATRAARMIGREALHNIARHAGARRITVEIGELDDGFFIAIADDGRGFATGAPRESGLGLGLDSMTRRARDAGGALTIESRPRAGTRVRAQLPFRDPALP